MTKQFCVLLLLLIVGGGCVASPLGRGSASQPPAAEALTEHLAFLAAANVSPQLLSLWHRLERDDLPPHQRQALLTLSYQLILDFNRQLAERPLGADGLGTAQFVLTAAEGSDYSVLRASGQLQLSTRVAELVPRGVNYAAARERVAELVALASHPWPAFSPGPLIRPGDRHPQVDGVRQVLSSLGDYRQLQRGRDYDADLVAALQAFQRRHGLVADGVIGPKTRAWLRVTPRVRAQRLARNILRQWHDRSGFKEHYLLVNIPEYRLRWISPTGERFSSRVIVGRNSRRTPRMATELVSLVVNPAWNVPRSIVKRDLLPKIRHDGSYLVQNRFDAFDRQGIPVFYSDSQWQEAARGHFPYRLSQRPGNDNALGRFKFHLTNSKAIYLHDTPQRRLFDRDHRALSSGCVRVEGADILARQLAFEGEVRQSAFKAARNGEETRWFKLSRPLPVYLVYWSAWMDPQGVAQFRRDIYHQDGDLDHKITIAMNASSDE